MEAAGEMVQIRDGAGLEKHLALWQDGKPADQKPVGYILSLEGADSLIGLEYVDLAWEYGLRAIGPAHYGPGRYANGTDAMGKMNRAGLELLKKMEDKGIILDATHLCDDAFWQAMEHYDGPVWASHQNCRALVAHNRQFSDAQLKELIRRDAVIGVPFDAWMIVPGWVRGQSTPRGMDCNLEKVADHIDHICQLAGNARHVGIGSDLDGGFGREQCPYEVETIADLQKIPDVLARRGYTGEDVRNMMWGNWVGFLRRVWRRSAQ
jgi:membrane dipeptidase